MEPPCDDDRDDFLTSFHSATASPACIIVSALAALVWWMNPSTDMHLKWSSSVVAPFEKPSRVFFLGGTHQAVGDADLCFPPRGINANTATCLGCLDVKHRRMRA